LDISKGGAEPAFFQLDSYPRLRGVLPTLASIYDMIDYLT